MVTKIARAIVGFVAALGALASVGCIGTPTPLAPALRGSIGVPHQGVITNAVQLPRQGEGYKLFRKNGVNWGNPRIVALIRGAAREVARARPGGPPLVIGDISARFGGQASGHRSHRTGRDADLLIFALTPDGRPVESPGFLEYGPDGIARSKEKKGRFYRVDVEREWLLVKALIRSPEANVQWLFLARWLEALVIEHARARGEDPELLWQAENMLLQPGDSAAHDDHLHLRVACTPDESVEGCEGGGPYWPWLAPRPQLASPPDADLARSLVDDLLPGAAPSSPAPSLSGPSLSAPLAAPPPPPSASAAP